MQKILKWLTPLISIGVGLFIVFFIISINRSSDVFAPPLVEQKQEIAIQKQKNSWLDGFSKTQNTDYYYPVNEVLVRFDLLERQLKSSFSYKLLASVLDPYQLFCLEEELKHSGFKYILNKNNNDTELLIFCNDQESLQNFLEVLKKYEIKAHIEQNKEEA